MNNPCLQHYKELTGHHDPPLKIRPSLKASSTVAPTTTSPVVPSSTASAPSSSTNARDVQKVGNIWKVSGVGNFDNRAVYDFSQGEFPDGLIKSDYTISQRQEDNSDRIPYNPQYKPANVQVVDGFLTLTVPGRQKPTKRSGYRVSCAEITTAEQNILYASVRTNAILSSVPGTCAGKKPR